MALPLRSSSDPLVALTTQFMSLRSELESMQLQYQAMGKHHGQLCSSALREALLQLFEVIRYVQKADKKLVDWHHRSKGLKVALRCIGVDRRTQTVIDKKTEQLKKKIGVVETKFDETGKVFNDGLDAVKALNAGIVSFSYSSVRDTSNKAQVLCDKFDEDCDQTREMISVQREESNKILEQSQTLALKQKSVQQDRLAAQGSRDNYATGSALSFGGAAMAGMAAFVAAPMLPIMAAGGLLALGATAACQSSEFDAQVRELQEKEGHLDSALKSTEKKIKALEDQLSTLDRNCAEFVQAKQTAQDIQGKAVALRRDAQDILVNLRDARTSLASTRGKVKAIAEQLRQSGYARSRKDIAERLRETLNIIQYVGTRRNMQLDQTEVARAMGHLLQIDGYTPQVLQLISETAV